jgi:hypothetical protein
MGYPSSGFRLRKDSPMEHVEPPSRGTEFRHDGLKKHRPVGLDTMSDRFPYGN